MSPIKMVAEEGLLASVSVLRALSVSRFALAFWSHRSRVKSPDISLNHPCLHIPAANTHMSSGVGVLLSPHFTDEDAEAGRQAKSLECEVADSGLV